MLEEIVVSNLGLIPSASLAPAEGLTVITGETGAGKTVMLGAMRILVGEPATKGLIGPHADTADVSARFVDSKEHVVRRIITQSRSKSYLDGAISTASALRDTIGPKVSIVGQHDQHTITSSDGVRSLVDVSLTANEHKDLETYGRAWTAYDALREEADLLGTDHRHLARDLETVRFQTAEIEDAGFAAGDEELLRAQATKLRNAEELAGSIDTLLACLGDQGAGGQITDAARTVEGAATLDPSLRDLADQILELPTALSDINADIVRYAADLDTDSNHLEETEQRIALLSSLKRKYGDSLESVLAFRKDATAREKELAAMLESADDIADRLGEAFLNLEVAGDSLRSTREIAADRIGALAQHHLSDLGFSEPFVEISIVAAAPTRSGADTATVLFASDRSLDPGPVSSIASGGELSRLVLALTLASGGVDTDVVAFDEIDAGVGGETALAMGHKLASLAQTRQVLCVTHLPQVAAFADKHYVVARDGATTSITQAAGADRTEELSRMLAGLSSSEKGKQHAEELLSIASAAKHA